MALTYTGEYNCILAGVLKQDTIFEVGNYSKFVLADFYLINIRRLLVCRLGYRNKSYFFFNFLQRECSAPQQPRAALVVSPASP